MLKHITIAIVAAIVATLGTLRLAGDSGELDQVALNELSMHLANHAAVLSDSSPATFRITEELEQDAWLGGVARDGSPRPGPADDDKPLEDSANSICFLTKVEVTAVDGQEDTVSCGITIDDFTGWWQVNAIQGDGSHASVRCNARCLVWE